MTPGLLTQRERRDPHPYLSGNYAPVRTELPLTACRYEGHVPDEFRDGQYCRNGGNPLSGEDEMRDAHWFDGDGMLTGVLFRSMPDGSVRPEFINRYVLTDVLLATSPRSTRPLLPSIATFSSPYIPLLSVLLGVLRTLALCLLTWLPGSGSSAVEEHERRLKRISVANTSVWFHDGKAFAGCESGPPLRVLLPGMETAGWWSGQDAADRDADDSTVKTKHRKSHGWGKSGVAGLFAEMTTAHPHVDPKTGELLLFHMSFFAPFLRVSIIPPKKGCVEGDSRSRDQRQGAQAPLRGVEVPGIAQPKQMHDAGWSSRHGIMLDLPLSLDPRNMLRGRPMLHYDSAGPTRFGIFPRKEPGKVVWFEEAQACLIFHTANAWEEQSEDGRETGAVSLLACRLNSATLVYSAGNTIPPPHALPPGGQAEQCRLHYWRFPDMEQDRQPAPTLPRRPSHSFALSAVPFEFPTMNEAYAMSEASFVYGASMRSGSFDAGLGRQSAKIDCLAKIDAAKLVRRGLEQGIGTEVAGFCVDDRTVQDILDEQEAQLKFAHGSSSDKSSASAAIRIFALPPNHFAQEATFVPRRGATQEDDGWLVFFVFDESQLDDDGCVLHDATSELWILEAKTMRDVICRVKLPQRVPYGLHGHFFNAQEIASQEPLNDEQIRTWILASQGVVAQKREEGAAEVT
ncbi:carotenoid oxygenase [Ceraceosorus guamensis]|uniref:Carotenoid oxygenase n=1 Tax=Ceraceosorus guamensis TaxID=1522189 RepID=A0A316W117_9BASI|nr:carotenoid oxygenase [Ceraceosorus guamensis]PWN42433.1 carotenoid oxygenase [Ceraceosorus guamensis]